MACGFGGKEADMHYISLQLNAKKGVANERTPLQTVYYCYYCFTKLLFVVVC